jgi:hypothetical protein
METEVKKLIAVAVMAVIGLAAVGTTQASASTGWHGCAAPVRTIEGYEYRAQFSDLSARAMNCASARSAYAYVSAKRHPVAPTRFNDATSPGSVSSPA